MALVDLTGQRFGKLTVIERAKDRITPNGKHHTQWLCRCDCGNTTIGDTQKLRKGHKKSCGCILHENKSQNFVDLTGQRFHLLTVVKFIEKKDRTVRGYNWLCRCDCGNYVKANADKLKKGLQQSCGCYKEAMKPWIGMISRKYKYKNKRLYGVYQCMVRRVYGENTREYHNYGGRGIKVCDEWLGEYGYDAFAEWAFANGYDDKAERGKLTLDRIDVNGNYEPSNCRWISNAEQQYNKRTCVMLDYDGETHCMKEWSRLLNIPYGFIQYHHKKHGQTLDEIVAEYNGT